MSVLGAFVVPHPPMILPEIGRGRQKDILATINAYREISQRIAELKPDTVVLSSPHSVLYADYIHISPGERAAGDMLRFGADVRVEKEYDTALVEKISELCGKAGVFAGTLGERDAELDHGTIIPLVFLDSAYTNYKLVRAGLSGLSAIEHYRFGKCVSAAADALNRRVVYIASGDLSHKLTHEGPYGFAPEGPVFDSAVTQALSGGDFLRLLSFTEAESDAAAECGLRSFQMMAGALDGKDVKCELLSYEGITGVGYAVASFSVLGNVAGRRFDEIYLREQQKKLEVLKANEDEFVKIARNSLETYVKTGEYAELPGELSAPLSERAGVFVSLKKRGRLRGCIGTISPVAQSIAEEISRNAVCAGCEDPRFEPVTEAELSELVYSVDVLGTAEPCERDELDIARYGVIVVSGRKRGLLLPNLEGVDSVEQQIEIARKKAGIAANERYSLLRFEVVRHK